MVTKSIKSSFHIPRWREEILLKNPPVPDKWHEPHDIKPALLVATRGQYRLVACSVPFRGLYSYVISRSIDDRYSIHGHALQCLRREYIGLIIRCICRDFVDETISLSIKSILHQFDSIITLFLELHPCNMQFKVNKKSK